MSFEDDWFGLVIAVIKPPAVIYPTSIEIQSGDKSIQSAFQLDVLEDPSPYPPTPLFRNSILNPGYEAPAAQK